MIREFRSASARARLDRATEFLQSSDTVQSTIAIAATRRAADELVRQAAESGLRLFGVKRTTPSQWAAELSAGKLADTARVVLTPFARQALVQRVLQKLTLKYYAPVQDTPGFVQAVASTIERLRQSPESQASLPALGPRGEDLVLILQAYGDGLSEALAVDKPELFALAASELPETSRLVCLDLGDSLGAERHFIEAAQASAGRHQEVLCVDHPAAPSWQNAYAEHHEPEHQSCLAQAQSLLFSAESTARESDGSVSLHAASGEAAECTDIARRVLAQAEAGVSFDRQAVFVRHPARYLALLLDAFARAEVPVFTTKALRRPDPAGRALLALLDCAADGVSASGFAEYLSFAQVPKRSESGAPPSRSTPWIPAKDSAQLVFFSLETEVADKPQHLEAPTHWERLLVDAAVRGGVARWERRLKGTLKEFEIKASSPELSPARQEALHMDAERLRALAQFALPLVRQLSDLPDSANWGTWLEALAQTASMALANPTSVIATLEQLRPIADLGPVQLRQVRHVLAPWLSQLTVEPQRDRYGAVFVAGVDEARGRSFEVVHLPGLAEGSFPAALYGDPLLPDFVGVALQPPITVRGEQRQEERSRLRWVVQAAEQRLLASYPRVDLVHGRARVPSFYALELLRAAEGRALDPEALQRRAQIGAGSVFGWPLPPNRSSAIDDIEYDLHTIAPLLMAPPDVARGRGQYLRAEGVSEDGAAPWLRALRQAHLRGRAAWSSVDGLLSDDPEIKAALAASAPSARPYSATALQHFAYCPYRFHLQAGLRLRPREEEQAVEHLDPRTYGSLFHEAQELAFKQLTAADLIPFVAEDEDSVRQLIDAVFVGLEARWREELAPAIAEVWQRELETMRRDLQRWAAALVRQSEWEPLHAELAFGLEHSEGRDPASQSEPVALFDTYQVRGAIDWIERRVGKGEVRVIDHKTGRWPPRQLRAIGGGKLLQPLIYAAAAAALLKAEVQEGQLYFCSTTAGFKRVTVKNNDKNQGVLQEALQIIDKTVQDGRLIASPDRGACRFCDYKIVCGSGREQQVHNKEGNQVTEALAYLRGLA